MTENVRKVRFLLDEYSWQDMGTYLHLTYSCAYCQSNKFKVTGDEGEAWVSDEKMLCCSEFCARSYRKEADEWFTDDE